jgi:hypothetical protein
MPGISEKNFSIRSASTGTFCWPTALAPGAQSVTLDERALVALLDGIDVDVPARKRSRPRCWAQKSHPVSGGRSTMVP